MNSNPGWPKLEEETDISFSSEDIEFQLPDEAAVINWLYDVVKRENQIAGTINFIFCSDDFLHAMNVKYLQHDTLTDVITFPYSNLNVDGDIFISIDRVRENALDLNIPFLNEMYRVMIHGVLHLLGYNDHTEELKKDMRQKEDTYLNLIE